ncbi:protein enabled-like isoform X2 [Pimephales promelas]|uniref:protein enabled-like isoform X2 n=1 Tax=Pimephales promelas TaxID=90988 RepID=UPI0019554B13|nr:protein enabled-like isoform X2 [Pimephales promelas]
MDNVTINVLDSKGNVVMLTVSKDIAERMQNDQLFLSSVMEQVSAVETKALLSGPASAAKLLQPPIPCLTRSPVPLNLSFVKPSTSQCPTRPPVPPSTSQCPTRPPVPPSTSQCLTRPPVPPSTSQCLTRPPVPPSTSQCLTRPPVPPSTSQCLTRPPVPPSTSQCLTRPPVPPSTSQCLTRPPVPPSTSQCPTRPPVLLTSTVKYPPPATLQPGAMCGNPSESIQPSSPSFQSDRHESQEITHQMTLFLLDLTKTHQQLYFRNKMAFYKKLQNSFSQKGYNLSSEKIRKKLANMLTTYKRVKDRRRATGEGKITWEYYTLMDELFGSSGIGTALPGTIHSTPLGLEETSSKSRPTSSSQDQPAGASIDEQSGTSTIPNTSRQRRSQQPLQFLEAYEEHAERRTAVLESLVRPDLERWRRLKERRRRSFEKKMLTSLGTIVEELKKMGKRQEQIMHLLQNPHERQ